MTLTNDQIILLLRSIGNSLRLGRSVENSIYLSLKNSDFDIKLKTKWIKLLNLGSSYKEIFNQLAEYSDDKSISRVWKLLSKISNISSHETGEKILEIVENLEKNRQLTEKRKSLVKAQRYKVVFLGTMTSVFLGIISGLAPLFATFVAIFRNVTISNTVLRAIPFSLYAIAIASTYFTTDIGTGKLTFKTFLFSSLAYIISHFIAKIILSAIL
ncbi:MAG: hypothetical protein ACTSSH_01745 [Candidatus Heimdallarchaeota archaeon]